jgi:pentatricopeptide repeat protein
MLADIVSLLENETLYVAGFHVWKQLIYTSSFGATRIPARYDFIIKAFRYLSVAEPMYHPDHQLLRQGLVACDVLADSDLVWDLLRRAIINYSPSRLQLSSSDLHIKPHVPFQNFVTGMTICLKENNVKACEKILQISKKIEMTLTNRRSLHMLLLKGYANIGDWENTLRTIETMNAEKLSPDEECYGALFYAFAMSKQVDKARAMLEEMESGTSPIPPGPTCYDGFILACARGRAWDDILAAYDKMQALRIPLSAASIHGVILAAAKVGHRSKVKQYVESFVLSRAPLHGDGAVLALRILLKGIVIGNKDTHDELTLDEIRERLRILGQTQPSLYEPCLNLIRTLRMAESEESRPPPPQMTGSSGGGGNDSKNHDRRHSHQTSKTVPTVPMAYVMDRRYVAWRNMLTDLLTLLNTIDDGLESSTSHDTNKVEHI